MHTVIKITGDDVPLGGFLICADPRTGQGRPISDPILDQLLTDLSKAYPMASTTRVCGLDVVTDVVSEPGA